jgi:HSP20 family molecular chaperone IbpA
MSRTDIATTQSQTPEVLEQTETVQPLVDIYENDEEILLVADLPGVNADSLRLHVDANELSIEGKRGDEPAGDALGTIHPFFNFRRAFRVPRQVDVNEISAEMKNGVLHLHLPKQAALRPRQITVTSG